MKDQTRLHFMCGKAGGGGKHLVQGVIAPLVADMLSCQSVVLDFPANSVQSCQWSKSIYQQAGSAHTLHYVNAGNDLCLSRIAKRNVERPEGSRELDEAAFMYITSFFEPPSASEGFDVLLHEQGV